jgi:pimeloyl-ACP methyl ester carboxylesterase
MNAGYDVRPLLRAVAVPVLVLHHAHDPVYPPEHGRYVAAHLPDARYVELPGNCHVPLSAAGAAERRRVAAEVADFLGDLGTGAGQTTARTASTSDSARSSTPSTPRRFVT